MEWSVLFMGPVGAGKTRAIRTISEIDVVATDVVATDDTRKLKDETTVDFNPESCQSRSSSRFGTLYQSTNNSTWKSQNTISHRGISRRSENGVAAIYLFRLFKVTSCAFCAGTSSCILYGCSCVSVGQMCFDDDDWYVGNE